MGSLAGGAASIVKTINEAKEAMLKLDAQKRHNLAIEGQKVGNGLYLEPNRDGYGLFISRQKRPKKITAYISA